MAPADPNQQRSLDDLGTPLHDVTFCVVDLETTGGSPEHDRITEIGAVKLRGGECLGTFQTLVNPGCAIPPSITVLTGITEAMVLPAPRIEQVLPSLLEFVRGTVLVGHNVRFDLGFLNAALRRTGHALLPAAAVDTVALARRLVRDEVPDCRLGTLAARLRLDHRPSHRALDDALATADLLHLLLERAATFGVLGLDDLHALPSLAGHPHVAKLRHTDRLPRRPGVYLFHGARDEVLYVGKATNLRQRVRTYFSTTETRRKVGGLLRETQRISHVETPDPLTAAVLEQRYLHRLRPRYNRQGTTWERYCYVRLTTDEAWPRLAIVKDPAAHGVHLGPLPSRSMATLVVEAVHSALPLRRCTRRLGSRFVPAPDATPCSAAQLGVAPCPCVGQADAASYAEVVHTAERALTDSPSLVLDPLHDRIARLAAAQRFEEAAAVRDRAAAFAGAVRRQQSADRLRAAGRVVLRLGDVQLELDHGRLLDSRAEGVLTAGLPLPPPEPPAPGRPLPREAADELWCIARFLDTHPDRVSLVECSGEWTCSLAPVPRLERLPRLGSSTHAA
jgi:DNA polymerase-3 subunit epsilon